MSDGAGALLVVSEEVLKRYNLTPIARYEGFAVRGVPPEIMGIGPKEAIRGRVEIIGQKPRRYEMDRAQRSLRRPIAGRYPRFGFGHIYRQPQRRRHCTGPPAGRHRCRSGAATAIHGLRERGEKGYAMVTMCIGTGMGAAGLIEVL